MVAVAMCDENLGYFSWFDAGSSLDGKLHYGRTTIELGNQTSSITEDTK